MQRTLNILVLLCAVAGMCHALIYMIAPSLEKCKSKVESCYTVADFVANTNNLLNSNTTLVVLKGEHIIDKQFSIEQIMIFAMTSSHNATIKCESSTELQIRKVGYINLSTVKFRKCQFIVQNIGNLFVINVEISDLMAIFNSALKLLKTNANIVSSIFSKITVINNSVAVALVALLMQMRET